MIQRLIGIVIAGVLLLLVLIGLFFGVPYSKTTDLDLGSAVIRVTTRWGPFTSVKKKPTPVSLYSDGPWAAPDWMNVTITRGTLAASRTMPGPAAKIMNEFSWFVVAQLDLCAEFEVIRHTAELIQQSLPDAANDPIAADVPATLGLYLGTHTLRFQATIEGVDRVAELHRQGMVTSENLWERWHELELGEALLVEREDGE